MAEDLKFSIGFDEIKTDNIDKLWKAKEKEIQDIIDKTSKLQLKIDDVAVENLGKALSKVQDNINKNPIKIRTMMDESAKSSISDYFRKLERDSKEGLGSRVRFLEEELRYWQSIDVSSNKVSRKVQSMNDELNNQVQLLNSISNSKGLDIGIKSERINAVTAKIEDLKLAIADLDDFAKKITFINAEKQAQRIALLKVQINELRDAMLRVAEAQNTAFKETEKIDKQTAKINELRTRLEELAKTYKQIQDRGELYTDEGDRTEVVKQLVSEYNKVNQELNKEIISIEKLANEEERRLQKIAKENVKIAEKQAQEKTRAEKSYYDSIRQFAYQSIGEKSIELQRMQDYYSQLERTSANAAAQEAELNRLIQEEAIKQKEMSDAEARRGSARYKQSQEIARMKQDEINKSQEEYRLLIEQIKSEQKLAQVKAAALNKERQASRNKTISEGRQIQAILLAEEKTLASINSKLALQRQRLEQAVIGSAKYQRISEEIKRLEQTLNSYTNTQQRTANAQQMATKATHQQNAAWSTQKGILNGMPQMINSYLSILGAARTLSNIKTITAEFELQRVSLAAITRDAEFAEQLFNRIKVTAIASPFTTKELVTYTKQLAAYRIENEQLYGTMNQLADISAGLGVSMDRLVLAYGQVKAASVLRGTELRQFTEAGIPLVDLLAKKFSQLRGEVVSTGDVFELISERAVPFELVKEIFEDMTKAGGTFYQMQKKQAESLYGVWANVPDNIQLAFDKLGRENRGVLIGLGKGVTALFQNFDKVVNVVEKGAVAFGAYRLAVFLSTQALGNETKALIANEVAAKKVAATKLIQEGLFRKLNDTEKAMIATMNQLSFADKRRLVESGRLNQMMLQRMLVTGKLSSVEFARLSVLAGLDKAEAIRIARFGVMRKATLALGLVTKAFAIQLKALLVTLVSNPLTWVVGIAAVAMRFYQAYKEARDFKKELDSITTDKFKKFEDEAERLKVLVARLRVLKEGTKEYLDTLTELNNSYGVYLPNLDSAADKNDYLAKNIDKVTSAIKRQKLESALIEVEGKVDEKFASELADIKEEAIENLNERGKLDAITAENIVTDMFEAINKKVKEGGDVSAKEIQNITKEVLKRYGLLDKYTRELGKKNVWMFNFDNMTKAVDVFTDKLHTLESAQKHTFAKFSIDPKTHSSFKAAEAAMNNFIETQSALIQQDKTLSKEDKAYQIRAMRMQAYKEVLDKFGQSLPTSTAYIANALRDLQFSTNGVNGAVNTFVDNLKGLSQAQKDYYKIQPSEGNKAYFERLNDLMDKNTEKIKLNKSSITNLSNIKVSDPAHIKSLSDENITLIEQNKIIGQILAAFNQLKETKAQGAQVDPLQIELENLKSAYKEYQDLRKIMSESQAKEQTKQIYGIEIDDDAYRKGLEKIQSSYAKIGDKVKAAKIGNLIFEFDANQVESKIKSELDDIKDLIKRESEAKDFYQKILGLTGDEELSQELTIKFGAVNFDFTTDVRANLVKRLQDTLAKLKIKEDIIIDDKIDTKALNKVLKDSKFSDEQKKILEESFKLLTDYDSKTLLHLLSSTEKFKDEEDKKTKIIYDNQKLRLEAERLGLTEYLKIIDKKEKTELAALDFEALKKNINWGSVFVNLENTSIPALEKIKEQISSMKGVLAGTGLITEIKELEEAIKKIDDEIRDRNPFRAISEGWNLMSDAMEAYNVLNESKKALQDKINLTGGSKEDFERLKNIQVAQAKALTQASKGFSIMSSGFSKLSGFLDSVSNGLNDVANLFEDLFGENEFSSTLKDFSKGFSILSKVIGVVAGGFMFAAAAAAFFGTTINTVMPYLLILVAVAAAIGAVFAIFNARLRAIEKQQDALKAQIKQLEYAYEDLTRAMDKALGEKRLRYFRESIKNLEEQRQATLRLINLENQKKSKDRDDEQIVEWRREIEKLTQQMEDALDDMLAVLLDENLTSAAEKFAQSWIDAYLSFEDTKQALTQSFKDMLKNLIVKSVLAATMERALKGVYEAAAGYVEGKISLTSLLATFKEALASVPAISQELEDAFNALGLDLKALLLDTKGLAKLQQGVETITEDKADIIASYVGLTLQNIILIRKDVRLLVENMLAKVARSYETDSTSLNDLILIQSQSLTELRAINNNTLRTAKATEKVADVLDSATINGGITKINVNL